MIEKLNRKLRHERDSGFTISEPVSIGEMQEKINELVDAVNRHEDIIRQISEWGSSKGECLWCENLTEVNLDDRMIGCTTLDIPESYTKSCRMDKEFAEEECARLQNELDRTRKALDVAVDALKTVKRYLCEMPAPDGATVLRMACESATTVKKALEQITALEQKNHFANASKKVEQKDVK